MAIAIRGTTPATAIQSTDPTSVTLTGARQPQAQDVLVIVHHNNFYALSAMPTPTVGGSTTGVTSIVNADAGANGAHIKSWFFVVGSTGDLTVAVDETGPADEEKGLAVYVLSGVDTANPVDTSGGAANTGGTTHVAPSVSPATANAYLICAANPGGGPSNTSYTPPGTMAEAYDAAITGICVTGATEQLAASGPTGTRTFTPNTSETNNAEITIAMRTASGAAAVAPKGVLVTDSAVRAAQRIRRWAKGTTLVSRAPAAPAGIGAVADVGVITLTGVDPALSGSGSASVTADVGVLTLQGVDPSLSGTGSSSATVDPAVVTFQGVDVVASTGAASAIAAPTVVAGQAVDTAINRYRHQANAQFVDMGSPINLEEPGVIVDPAVLTFVGVTPVLAGSGIASIAVDPGILTLLGVTPAFSAGGGVVAADAPLKLSFSGSTATDHSLGSGSTLDLSFGATLGTDRSVTFASGVDFVMSVTFSGMLPPPEEGAMYGPCSPWEVTWCCPDTVVPEVKTLAAEAATELLWALSGRQFGFCTGWLRPCRKDCFNSVGLPWWDDSGSTDWIRPALLDGAWSNITCGTCVDDCGCSTTEKVTIPGVVDSVISVQIDGDVLAADAYRLDNKRTLVRQDGGKWPLCQDYNAASGPGTWFVEVQWGRPVPSLARLAVSELANEFVNACTPGQKCKLPQRVTQVDRNGVTIALDDIQALLREGQLGLTQCDYFISSVNPNGLAQRSRVYSPDVPSLVIQRTAPA